MNRSIRTILVISLMFAALAPSTAPARSSDGADSRTVTLGARNVVTGRKAASVAVRLDRPATMRLPEFSKSVKVRGGSGLVGFALAETPFDAEHSSALISARVPVNDGGTDVLSLNFGFRESNKGYHLPAGNYRLYLVTEGRSATVEFNLNGVGGTRRLSPRSPAGLEIKTPPVKVHDDLKNIHSGGSDSRLRSDGILFNHLWVSHTAHASSVTHFCYMGGAPEPADHPLPYGPGCPSLNDKFIFTQPSTYVETSPDLIQHYGGGLASAARWGQGFSQESGGIVDGIGFTSLWLELR